MQTVQVGMREFRDNMATYLLEAKSPIEITRHGERIGLFLPMPKPRTEVERRELREESDQLHKMMAEQGVTEEEIIDDFKQFRAAKRR